MSKLPLPDLGAYLREQRQNARMSLRQLADAAGISNPYLSQIERGLKRPSADILQQIARGLQVSAESLYIRAGILDERIAPDYDAAAGADVLRAIAVDPALTDRQRAVLVEIYRFFVGSAADDTDAPLLTETIKRAAQAPSPDRPSSPSVAVETTQTSNSQKEN